MVVVVGGVGRGWGMVVVALGGWWVVVGDGWLIPGTA